MIDKSQNWQDYKTGLKENREDWLMFLSSLYGTPNFSTKLMFLSEERLTRNVYNSIHAYELLLFPKKFSKEILGKYDVAIGRRWSVTTPKVEHPRKYTDFEFSNLGENYIVLDFDAKNLEDGFEDVGKVNDRLNGKMRLYFTGGRGFHIYIDTFFISNAYRHKFETMKLKVYDASAFKDTFINGLNLKTIDKSNPPVFRLPYSMHTGTGRFCIPCSADEDLAEIISRSETVPMPAPVEKQKVVAREVHMIQTHIPKKYADYI